LTHEVPRITSGNKIGQVDATKVPRFAGLGTFARLPRLDEVAKADIAIVGVPFDAGVSYRSGARFGPNHIRESSRLLRPYNPAQDASPFALAQVVDVGDIAANPFDIAEAVEQIGAGMDDLLAKQIKPVVLGGDHTIAYPIIKSLNKIYGPVTVIHFDAHLDTWDTYFGAPLTHGTPFRRASEDGLLDMSSCLHVGIRGPLYTDQDLTDDTALGFQVITAASIDTIGTAGVIEKMLKRVGNKPVYVSIDVDVMDPAFAPGTGTPEMGGLSSREMLALIRSLENVNLIGADIVEVSPQYDNAQITGIAAANLAYELITILARSQK
jgi:agmatinase